MLLIHRQLFGVNEFVFHRFKEVIIKLKAHFECPIGHSPFTLEQIDVPGRECHRRS